jgi:hypothetical protein
MYGTDLSDEENAENMYQMFVNLPAEVITKGVSKMHKELSKFFCAEYFDDESTRQRWTFGFIAWDSTMFYRYLELLCSGY